MRATMKRRQRTRRITLLSVAAVIVIVFVVAVYALTLISTPNSLIGKPVTSDVYQPLYRIAQTTYVTSLTSSSFNPSSLPQKQTGQEYTSGLKPVVVYVGGEFCPYCAFQRWPLVMALMRFGNFSNLHYMMSSSSDVYPNSATFTFVGSTYTSSYVVFQPFEQENRGGQPLQTVPSNYTSTFATYGSSYPFENFANKYVVEGPFFTPNLIAGLNWTQIVHLLSVNSQFRDQVISSTNEITAIICNLTGGNPSSVCANSSVGSFSTTLTAYHSGPRASLNAGIPISTANEWARVQYGQMALSTKSSTKIR